MNPYANQERRPLKRSKHGTIGPEVYPQDKKQKEDELSQFSVKHGFSNISMLKDEYGSARDASLQIGLNILSNKVITAFANLMSKKYEINTYADQSKRKLPIANKDNFYPIGIPKGKQLSETWFKEDLIGNKPLALLAKKVPVFIKKEDIFQKLGEENAPLLRAIWFIKMTNTYNVAMYEIAKSKKRHALDPFNEWTQALARYMKELIQKLIESTNLSNHSTYYMNTIKPDIFTADNYIKQWNYICSLASRMYEEGLLDRQEFLTLIIHLLDKTSDEDLNILKLVIAQALKFSSEFVQSQVLSRLLANFCCIKISEFCCDGGNGCSSPIPSEINGNTSQSNQLKILSFSTCPLHRGLVLQLSSILHCILLRCPAALVWHRLSNDKQACPLNGSPLDYLPISVASLPLTATLQDENKQIRVQLKVAEDQVVNRSKLSEQLWPSDKTQQSDIGITINRILTALEILDHENFEQFDNLQTIDNLFSKIFQQTINKETQLENLERDEALVELLCEWAVTTKRSGYYRPIIVAKLLDRYQNFLLSEKNDGDQPLDVEDVKVNNVTKPILQNILLKFLDNKAPVLDANSDSATRQAFSNLVLLFGELISHEIFSHDQYICTLVARGNLHMAHHVLAMIQSMRADCCPSIERNDPAHHFMKHENENIMEIDMEAMHQLSRHDIRPSPDISGRTMLSPYFTNPTLVIPTFSHPNSARTPGGPTTPASVRSSAPHTPGTAHTPSGQLTPVGSGGMYTPSGGMVQNLSFQSGSYGMMQTSGGGQAHTPGSASQGHGPVRPHTPGSSSGILQVQMMSHSHVGQGLQSNMLPSFGSNLNACQEVEQSKSSLIRHIIYVTHFPVTSYDQYSHENNQRMVVLYGVGKPRDEARHAIRKVTRDLSKVLFSKRGSCIDAMTGEIGKKERKKKEKDSSASSSCLSLQSLTASLPCSLSLPAFNLQAPIVPQNPPPPDTGLNESLLKFKKLPFHDQHLVAYSLSRTLLDLISSFLTGSSIYLPSVDSISTFFDIMEASNILTHLISITINLISKVTDFESRLIAISSPIAPSYPSQLSLCLIAVLRKLSNCIFITNNTLVIIFESLLKLVRNIDRPHECTSTDRCILVYLFEIFAGSEFIKVKFFDTFASLFERVKATIFDDVEPSNCSLLFDQEFSRTVLSQPKVMPDVNFIRQLNCKESSYDRYSFVCSVLVSICSSQDADRINDLSVLCCDLTSCCNRLTSDWLGVLRALCLSSNHNCGFIDMLFQVEVTDLSIHDSLAVFTSILVARNCLPLEEFVDKVALPSLMASCRTTPSGTDNDVDCEPGARLTLHLLLRLFQSGWSSVNMSSQPRGMYIHAASNRRLLHAVRKKIEVGAVVAVLKAVLMLGDYDSFNQYNRSSNLFSSQFFDESMDNLSKNRFRGDNANLGEYARSVLFELCRQDWIREKCLSEPDQLLTPDMLLDKLLSHNQARHLAQMICHANTSSSNKTVNESEGEFEKKFNPIGQMLQSLNQWSLRVSLLELQLLIKQTNLSEMTSLLDSIAMSTIDALQQHSESKPKLINYDDGNIDSIWFLAPLISRMPIVQGRILKAVGQVLEAGSNFSNLKNTRDREKNLQKSASLLSNQSLLNLIMLCLTNQDEESEALLKSLHDQLEKFVTNSKEQNDRGTENPPAVFYDALRLRLSLVGSMFSSIQRNQNLLHDWSLLFVQLICSGIVDIQTNSTLFTMIIDMLSTLIDGIVPPLDSNDAKTEEQRKAHHSLIRKLKKELGDRQSSSIDEILKLLPLPKKPNEVIVCEPISSTDSKNKLETQIEKSLQIARKELLNPWDIIETQKNPSVLSLSWFGASRRERKPLTYVDQHRLLLYHTHTFIKSDAFFLEPPLLPAEEFEQPIEKQEVKQLDQIFEPKMDSVKNKKTNRQRSKTKPVAKNPTPNPAAYKPSGPVPSMNFQRPDVYPGNSLAIGVYYNQPYPAGRTSFAPISNPRQVLNTHIKTRQPYFPPSSMVQTQWPSQRPRGPLAPRMPRMMVDPMYQGVSSQGQTTASIVGQNFAQQSVTHQGYGAGYSSSMDNQHAAQFKQQPTYPVGSNNQTVNRYSSMQGGSAMGSGAAAANPTFTQMARSTLNPTNQPAANFQNNPSQQQPQRLMRQPHLMMQSSQQPQQMMQSSQQMLQHHPQLTHQQQIQQQLQQRQNSQAYNNYQTF